MGAAIAHRAVYTRPRPSLTAAVLGLRVQFQVLTTRIHEARIS